MKRGGGNNKRMQWTKAQDKFLVSVVKNPDSNWSEVAHLVNDKFRHFDRTGKMCRERWYNYLSPDIKTEKITTEEEVQIFDLYKKYGNKWVEIAKELPGRTENWVKNLYYATLRRYVRNINKFKGVQQEIKLLDGIDI
jgi:myb proto-oncogene protein